MKIAAWGCLVVSAWSGSAPAQSAASGSSRDVSLFDVEPATGVRAGSPSNATATVSPTTVPDALDRAAPGGTTLDVSVGALYAGGDFGTASRTSIVSSALGARLRLGNWRVTASLPWMRIRSRSTIFTGIDSTPVLVAPDTSVAKTTAKGLGDLTLGAAYTIAPAGSATEIELSGRAKVNTASRASGLSSGRNDYALGAEVTHQTGSLAPFASVTYRILGDTARYRLRDGFAASAGASLPVGAQGLVLASYHYARSATRFVSDSHELFAGASSRLGRSDFRITGFATKGLSRGTADYSGGLALSFGFRNARGV